MPDTHQRPALARHWRSNLRLTGTLLLLWFAIVLGAALFARELNEFHVFGVPGAFYLFAQGAPILFLVIIGVYARAMNRLDRQALAGDRMPDATPPAGPRS